MLENKDNFSTEQDLEGWVMTKCDAWRDHYEANYSQKFEEYYRLWRGIWSKKTEHAQQSVLGSLLLHYSKQLSLP